MKQEWYEAKVKYVKTLDDGTEKKVTENYLVRGVTVSAVESRVIKELKSVISGEFSVEAVKRASFKEFFCVDGEKFFNCKVAFVTVAEDGTEKRQKSTMLVQADTFQDALDMLEEGMKGTMSDWEICSMSETAYKDVFN